jgi:N-formylglutamate amidohydrolase
VAHAGTSIPPEVADVCRLTPDEIAADGDAGAAEIYDLADHVLDLVTTDVARAVVDMNRAVDDRRKDGVVKTHTCWDVPVYRAPLPDELADALIQRYWRPYHDRLRNPPDGAILGVDGHTMAARGPPVGPDPGAERPWVCLGGGDGSLPKGWFAALADCFAQAFGREPALDEPFRGGYIVRAHAAELPWVLVEVSRAPFLTEAEKRSRVLRALELWCARHREAEGVE